MEPLHAFDYVSNFFFHRPFLNNSGSYEFAIPRPARHGIWAPQRIHAGGGSTPVVVAIRKRGGHCGRRAGVAELGTMVFLKETAQLVCINRGVGIDKAK